jgi:hypothetical protein
MPDEGRKSQTIGTFVVNPPHPPIAICVVTEGCDSRTNDPRRCAEALIPSKWLLAALKEG